MSHVSVLLSSVYLCHTPGCVVHPMLCSYSGICQTRLGFSTLNTRRYGGVHIRFEEDKWSSAVRLFERVDESQPPASMSIGKVTDSLGGVWQLR